MIPLHLLVGMDEFVHIGSISCSRSQGKTSGSGSVTATACSYRCRHHLMPLGEGHNPPPRALLCSQMQFMIQPIQSCCSVTKGAVNYREMWEGTLGMRTCLKVLSACSNTAKQLLARQGLLLPHRWDPMLHRCCTVRQTGTSHCVKRMAGAKGRPPNNQAMAQYLKQQFPLRK